MKLKRILLGFVVFVLLIAILLPWGLSLFVSSAMQSYLDEQGMREVNVQKVWVNPYSILVELEELSFIPENGDELLSLELLSMEISLVALARKEIKVIDFTLVGVDLNVQLNDEFIDINGFELPLQSRVESNLDSEVAQNSENEEVNQSELDDSQDNSTDWSVVIDSIEIRDVRLNAQAQDLSTQLNLKQLEIQGIDTNGSKGQVNIDIDLNNIQTPDVQVSQQISLFMPTSIKLGEGNELTVAIEPKVTLDNLAVITPEYELNLKSFVLDTIADLALNSYSVSSEIKMEDLSLAYANDVAGAASLLSLEEFGAVIDLQSRFHSDESEDQLATSSDFEQILIQSLNLKNLLILESDKQDIPTLVNGLDISIDQIELVLPEPEENSSSESSLASVLINSILLESAEIKLLRDEEGGMPQFLALETNSTESGSIDETVSEQESEPSLDENEAGIENEQEQNTSPAIDLQIGSFAIADSLTIDFDDLSLTPAFTEHVQFQQFELSDLKPLDSTHQSYLSASLLLKHDALLTAKGQLSLDGTNTDLKVSLSDYQLLQVSAYSELYTSYALESGTFNLDSDIKIIDSQLDINNNVLIDQLVFRAANSDGRVRFVNELTMPLDQVMDLLRNSDNEIHLELPVTGAMDSPDFEIQQIINRAIGGAMKKASVSLLKNLLQPYSTALSVAQFAGDQLTRVRLDPIELESGETTLNGKDNEYAVKIASLLEQKQSLSIRLCGSTNKLDKEKLVVSGVTAEKDITNQLYEMAELRASTLKSHLVDSLNVNAEQLLACLPIHSEDGVSGIELNI